MKKSAIKEVVARNSKGEAIIKIGPTGSGKSHFDLNFTDDKETKKLLNLRKANGEGTLINTEIIVTDDDEMPISGIIIYGEISRKTIANIGADNIVFSNIIFDVIKYIKKSKKRINEEMIKGEILKILETEIRNSCNSSILYKIKGISEVEKKGISDLILKIVKKSLILIEPELSVKQSKSGEERREFNELILKNEDLKNDINKIWEIVIKVVNEDINRFVWILKKQDNIQSYVEDDGNSIKFGVYLERYDKNEGTDENYLANVLLKSEDNSKEYMFEKLVIIFRAKERYIDIPELRVAKFKENKKDIHVLRFIDTQGILHGMDEPNKNINTECERIIDTISQYESKNVLLFIPAEDVSNKKEFKRIIKKFLSEYKREVIIQIIVTKFDKLINQLLVETDEDFEYDEDLEEVENKAKLAIKNDIEELKKEKKYEKIIINEEYIVVGLFKRLEILEYKTYTYNSNIKNIIKILSENIKLSYKSEKIVVTKKYDISGINKDTLKKNISTEGILRNIVECKDRADYSKGNELHYRTVKAIYEKWINNGIAHKSNISEESYYRNINTKYVTLIRNLVLDIIPSDLEIYDFIEMFGYEIKSKIKIMPSKRDNEEFKRSIGKYLSRLIGYDAYINGFQNCKEYRKYSYRFYDMIQYVQINYFRGKTLEINDKFLERLNEAIINAVYSFVNKNCIEEIEKA